MGKVHFRFHPSWYGGFKISGNDKPAEDMTGDYWPDADYEALEAKLDALLNGLQVKEITDLKTKSPDHFAKLAECITDDSQEKASKIMALQAKLAALVVAAEALVTGLELVHNDPEYQAVWQLYQAHVPTGYRGRKYTEVLDKLKATLDAAKEGK